MQKLYLILTFLSSLCFHTAVPLTECNDTTQYAWPMANPTRCCKKCLPGQQMRYRSSETCDIKCVTCSSNQFSDSHNVEMDCTICNSCSKPNMVLKSSCNSTHNAVCTCTDGYKCKDSACTQCQLVAATTRPTLPPSTTALTTETRTTTSRPSPVRDTVWFLVITALLCGGIALAVVTRIKPFLLWFRTKQGYFFTPKPAPVPQFAEDEEVSKPVQEVCGKCDQLIDV